MEFLSLCKIQLLYDSYRLASSCIYNSKKSCLIILWTIVLLNIKIDSFFHSLKNQSQRQQD